MSGQVVFGIGRLAIRENETIAALYILKVAEIGDNLRNVRRKLPAWIEGKNDIIRIFDKLVKLEIIRIIDATGGARITEISRSAETIAIDAINDIEVWQELLNSETEWFPIYEDI